MTGTGDHSSRDPGYAELWTLAHKLSSGLDLVLDQAASGQALLSVELPGFTQRERAVLAMVDARPEPATGST